MAEIRSPGVYYEPTTQHVTEIRLDQTGVPVFLGITLKGPLDTPQQITNEAQLIQIFGEPTPQSYLHSSIKGFFANGGEVCYVLRVARVKGAPGEEVACAALSVLKGRRGQALLTARAKNPGAWGDQLRLTLQESPEHFTLLTRDGKAGALEVQVESTYRLAQGALVCVRDPLGAHWARVRKLVDRVVHLDRPLPRGFSSFAPSKLYLHTFDLLVETQDERERFERLSLHRSHPRWVERIVNQQSRLIDLLSHSEEGALEDARPLNVEAQPLSGGADGLQHLGPEDFIGEDRGPGQRRGLMSLVEDTRFDLVVMPDLMAAFQHSARFKTHKDLIAVQEAAVSLCARSSNRFALLDMPPGGDLEEARRWRRHFDSPYAALYFPWIIPAIGPARPMPPSGYIAGVFARCDRQEGVHRAPANQVIEGIVDFEVLLRDEDIGQLNAEGVNCLRHFGPRGLRVWGARTCSGDHQWRYLNVRRTMSAISQAIEQGTQWVVFEPNSEALWKRLTRIIASFLMDLREQGMLSGQTPEEAFFVRCDHETNPPEDVERGMLTCDIGLAITRPVEFIIFRLSQRLEDQAQVEEELP
ncbi:phage tail sheath subtilisin-like domain-containing protein [Myxococcota bacterium]|nr:phage tail sheath subtilisin-like domain-containing protein [Myxococcota bacterium]MBU1431641.1 phage tail sheath subtilisin-like domain-containing protein [Myxococcota bacterium]MBU1899548.1 phage tail sheath subtilisin-like domain-containing protein [Myxococcota bacterium]